MTDVFCPLGPNGELLPPAVQATALAKYSRSPDSAKVIISKLTVEEADKFQEKWVVGYGHNSVAELAVLPVCFEGVSIVASKFIESWQRPGVSEKSTRYQEFSGDSFITPPGGSPTMKSYAKRFYNTYDRLGDRMRQRVATLMNMDVNERVVKARAFDNLRYLLPAGTGTHVGIVAFLRDIRDMVCALRGHPNPEFPPLGDALYEATSQICPTLLKHTEPDNFQLQVQSLGQMQKFDQLHPDWAVEIHRPHLLPNVAMQQQSFEAMITERYGMSWETFCQHMEKRPSHADVPDIFKTINITFDVIMDYGAFRDLQRHRRCEQYVEPLTPNYGYIIPDDIAGSDLEPEYKATMEAAHEYEDENVTYNTHLMQYMVPLGYLHRSQFQMDLKELYYIIELRTKPQGHISYRRVAYEMYKIAAERWPKLMQWARVIQPDSIGVHH